MSSLNSSNSTNGTVAFIQERDSFAYDKYYNSLGILIFIIGLIIPLLTFCIIFTCMYKYRRKYTKQNCQKYFCCYSPISKRLQYA